MSRIDYDNVSQNSGFRKIDYDKQSVGSIEDANVGTTNFRMGLIEDGPGPSKTDGGMRRKKQLKTESQVIGKKKPALNGELEDIDDEEIMKAYENINLSASALDNTSQRSQRIMPGGNGNPNRLPGIPVDHPGRKISNAQNLGERNNSVGSASVGKVNRI